MSRTKETLDRVMMDLNEEPVTSLGSETSVYTDVEATAHVLHEVVQRLIANEARLTKVERYLRQLGEAGTD